MTVAAQVVTVSIGLLSTIVLARLLSPDDYGIVAMVSVVTAFAGLFRDFGLSSAALQSQKLTHGQQSNLFWLNVALGAALSLALSVASPLVAWFYGAPELRWVTVALSFSFLFGSLGTQSGIFLAREMRFGRQAVALIFGAVANVIVSVFLATEGLRYWSLVWGQLTGVVATSTAVIILSPFRPGWPNRADAIGEMLRFGASVTAFDIINYFHRNLDNVLIGRYSGASALGQYSRAYALLMFPISNLRAPINAVALPALSRLRSDPEAYKKYYRRIAGLLAFVSMPFSALLFAVAHPFIEITLGSRWEDVAVIFSILATVSFVQPVITLWGVVALSNGMSRRYLHVGMFNAACSVAGFIGGLPWGPVGVAIGYAIATYISAYPILAWTFSGTPLRVGDFFAVIYRPITASVAAAAICLLVSDLLGNLNSATQLMIQIAIFVPCYLLIIFILPGGKNEMGQLMNLTVLIASPWPTFPKFNRRVQ